MLTCADLVINRLSDLQNQTLSWLPQTRYRARVCVQYVTPTRGRKEESEREREEEDLYAVRRLELLDERRYAQGIADLRDNRIYDEKERVGRERLGFRLIGEYID